MALTKVIGDGTGSLDTVIIGDGDAGSVTANTNGDELVVECSARGGISILTPDANEGNILFGSPSDNLGGFITYKQSNTTMEVGTSISSGNLLLYSGDGALAQKIDGNGHITKPRQPAFCVTPSSQQDNITANNSSQTIAFGSERFDQNSDFASNTFTAPVTGKYLLSMQLRFENADTASGYHLWSITTSNKTYQGIRTISGLSADAAYQDFGLTIVADMDANDTATVGVLIETGAAQSDIDPDSYFSGYLVC